MVKVKIQVEIDEKKLRDIDELAKSWKRSREEIISDALSALLDEYLDTIWKEKGSLKKRKGTIYSGKIPESEYKPEQ